MKIKDSKDPKTATRKKRQNEKEDLDHLENEWSPGWLGGARDAEVQKTAPK